MAPSAHKRKSDGSDTTTLSDLFDPILTALDAPDSPLSDVASDLSDWAEAGKLRHGECHASKRLKPEQTEHTGHTEQPSEMMGHTGYIQQQPEKTEHTEHTEQPPEVTELQLLHSQSGPGPHTRSARRAAVKRSRTLSPPTPLPSPKRIKRSKANTKTVDGRHDNSKPAAKTTATRSTRKRRQPSDSAPKSLIVQLSISPSHLSRLTNTTTKVRSTMPRALYPAYDPLPETQSSSEKLPPNDPTDSQEQCAQRSTSPLALTSSILQSTQDSPEPPRLAPPMRPQSESVTSDKVMTSNAQPHAEAPAAYESVPTQIIKHVTQPTLPLDGPYDTQTSQSTTISDPTQSLRQLSEGPQFGANPPTSHFGERLPSTQNGSLGTDQENLVLTQGLEAITTKLFKASKITPKPEPVGQPEVWADSRMDLCEALPYFRAYQSACYTTGGYARAFMFDKNAHVRDYMDSDVVISRVGGGLVKDKDSGSMKNDKDQVETSLIVSVRNNITYQEPVVIITGEDNPNIPSKPPHIYSVLDWFKPTYLWWEKSGGKKIARFRFEKLNSKKTSWWTAKNGEGVVEIGSLPPVSTQTCSACANLVPQVFLQGWMCLNHVCDRFWQMLPSDPREDPYEPEESSLTYDPRFLKHKTPWIIDDQASPLSFGIPEVSDFHLAGESCSQAFWAGIVCPDCGRCNARLSWEGWECGNQDCDFKTQPQKCPIPPAALHENFFPLSDGYAWSRDTHQSDVNVSTSIADKYRVNRYTIPGIDGFIVHMIANQTVNQQPGGPDDMFKELQQVDIGLRRRPLPQGKLKGDVYTRHFAVNYGMPYKFIAATSSESFEDAARTITDTRTRLNWAAKLILSQESGKSMDEIEQNWTAKEFNEVLALGYFEAQKINYHDDGERGLSPTIATLSLGSRGTMKLRMKSRFFSGVTSSGYYEKVALPGCHSCETRQQKNSELERLQVVDPAAYVATLKDKSLPTEMKLKKGAQAKEAISMSLGHGDIVIMHGAELQKYYEHSVEHSGKLRFALTCRHIDEASLKPSDRPEYGVGPDTGSYNGSSSGSSTRSSRWSGSSFGSF